MTTLDRFLRHTTIAGTALCAAIGGSEWAIACATASLVVLRGEAHVAFAGRHALALGHAKAWSLFTIASATHAAAISTAAFAVGRIVRALF
jgi:hypothetical protein